MSSIYSHNLQSGVSNYFFLAASAGVCLPSHHVQFEGDEICYFIAETPTAYVFDRAIGGSVAAGVLNSQTCESHQPSATTFLFDNSEETKTFIRRCVINPYCYSA